jgi:hypothetical protein
MDARPVNPPHPRTPLHRAQESALIRHRILEYIHNATWSPGYDELAAHAGCAKSTAHAHVLQLQREGVIQLGGPLNRIIVARRAELALRVGGDMGERPPQLTDDVTITITFPAAIEEWADELISDGSAAEVDRDEEGRLVVRTTWGGNTNALHVARGVLDEIEDALQEGCVDPMEFTLTAQSARPAGEDTR